MNREINLKTQSLEVKDVDPKTRRVKVALSAYDNIDSDGDIIRRGAFAKSILERGPDSTSNRKIAFLRHHDWEQPIGVWKQLEETNDHLVGIGELGRSTKGNDALLDYQDGIIREHSIGFNYIPDKMTPIEREGNNYMEVKEVVLWEGSAVTFGANSSTMTLDVSKGFSKEALEKINKEMACLISAIKSGGTDDRLYSLEMRLKMVKDKYNEIISLIESASKATDADEPKGANQANDLINFYNNLKF